MLILLGEPSGSELLSFPFRSAGPKGAGIRINIYTRGEKGSVGSQYVTDYRTLGVCVLVVVSSRLPRGILGDWYEIFPSTVHLNGI